MCLQFHSKLPNSGDNPKYYQLVNEKRKNKLEHTHRWKNTNNTKGIPLIHGTCLNLKTIMVRGGRETQKPYTVPFNFYDVLKKERKTLWDRKGKIRVFAKLLM